MRSTKIIPAPLPLPTAPATDSQRQALRELSGKVGSCNRSRVLNGLAGLTYAQASQQIGHYYLMATRQLGEFTRTHLVADDALGAVLPKGSLVLLRTVGADSLRRGDLVLCTDKNANNSLLGLVRRVKPGRFYNDLRLTLSQAVAEHTLWANRPYLFWYRVEVISLAC